MPACTTTSRVTEISGNPTAFSSSCSPLAGTKFLTFAQSFLVQLFCRKLISLDRSFGEQPATSLAAIVGLIQNSISCLPRTEWESALAHVFISYVRENSDVVDRLANEFTARGVTVWLDRNNIEPGARWQDAIKKAIRSGKFL